MSVWIKYSFLSMSWAVHWATISQEKNGFLGAGWVRAFPHEQPVLLRLISQALPVRDDLGVPVLISGFQVVCPFLNVAVNRKEKLDLMFLILEVIVFIGDNGHDLLFIQKRRELFATCAFFRFRLLDH